MALIFVFRDRRFQVGGGRRASIRGAPGFRRPAPAPGGERLFCPAGAPSGRSALARRRAALRMNVRSGSEAGIAPFAARGIPEVAFGRGRVRDVAADAAALGDPDRPVVLVTDGALVELGLARTAVGTLEQAGAEVMLFADIWGEPRRSRWTPRPRSCAPQARAWSSGLGGGSAMDVGKIAATLAATDGAPADFAMEGRPRPKRSIAKICIPTTAGTGSEFSSTNIFA